jgi:hypothetical protein
VAVAGWQWWQLIAEISAVRMVLVTRCGCQYWLGGSGLEKGLVFLIFFFCEAEASIIRASKGSTSGSGGVGVVPLDSWGQCGHFDTKFMWQWLFLAGWQWVL